MTVDTFYRVGVLYKTLAANQKAHVSDLESVDMNEFILHEKIEENYGILGKSQKNPEEIWSQMLKKDKIMICMR